MSDPAAGRSPRGGLGRVVAGTVAFVLVAPVGLLSLPLAAVAATARPRGRAALLVAVPAVLVSGWWLAFPGDLPDQTIRAAAVLATTTFAVSTVLTPWSVTHRALLGVGLSAVGISAAYAAFGWSWARLHWWVEHQAGFSLRFLLGGLWRSARQSDGSVAGPTAALLNQLETAFEDIVRTVANLYPATVALQLMAGFALTAAIYYRVAPRPLGRPPSPFRLFRFSEHIGWMAVVPLAVVLLPRVGAAKLVAANLLVVIGVLYALRGAAVAVFLLARARPGLLLYGVGLVALFFMMPVAVGAIVVLGVLDAGLDLRRRWATPSARA